MGSSPIRAIKDTNGMIELYAKIKELDNDD